MMKAYQFAGKILTTPQMSLLFGKSIPVTTQAARTIFMTTKTGARAAVV